MSAVKLRRQAKSMLDDMSARDLQLVTEFLAFVQSREVDAATRELLTLPGFAKSFARGARDVKAGRVTPWRQVRDDV